MYPHAYIVQKQMSRVLSWNIQRHRISNRLLMFRRLYEAPRPPFLLESFKTNTNTLRFASSTHHMIGPRIFLVIWKALLVPKLTDIFWNKSAHSCNPQDILNCANADTTVHGVVTTARRQNSWVLDMIANSQCHFYLNNHHRYGRILAISGLLAECSRTWKALECEFLSSLGPRTP